MADLTWIKWLKDLCAEKMKDTATAQEEGENREAQQHAEPSEKVQEKISSIRQGKDQH